MERAGFDFVDIESRPTVVSFRSGRDFFEDPVARFLILPAVKLHHGLKDADRVLPYLREAIDKYWSDGAFEMTLNVGCATGRRLP